MPKILWDLQKYEQLLANLYKSVSFHKNKEHIEILIRSIDVLVLGDHENARTEEFNNLCKDLSYLCPGNKNVNSAIKELKDFVLAKPSHSKQLKAKHNTTPENQVEGCGCLVAIIVIIAIFMPKCSSHKSSQTPDDKIPTLENKESIGKFTSRFEPKRTTEWAKREITASYAIR